MIAVGGGWRPAGAFYAFYLTVLAVRRHPVLVRRHAARAHAAVRANEVHPDAPAAGPEPPDRA